MDQSSRRQFLKTGCALAGALAAPGLVSAATSTQPTRRPDPKDQTAMPSSSPARRDRPNILLIMSDEHDPAVTGCYGDPLIRTPHMDALAAGGVTFDACYTTSPLCVPARLSFTAGKYASRCGAWNNDCALPPETPSLPRALARAGYQSFLCGKMHYDRRYRYGFHDLYQYSPNGGEVMHGRGSRRAANDASVNTKSWLDRSAEFRTGNESKIFTKDRRVTEHCQQFLAQRRPEDGPFFLTLGYIAPHFPLIVPQECHEPYRGRVPAPVLPPGLVESLPLNYQHLRRGFGVVGADPAMQQRGREHYWGLVHWFDQQVGQVLEALRASGLADNTVVIYTSDHGENKGDHGMWWKSSMYESAARIPLIVHYPKRWAAGQRRAGACSLVDLTQTILELAGGEPGADWDGRSMLGWLDNPAAPWRDLAVSEYYAHNIASGFAMLRQGPWKYVYHTRMDEAHGPERELYNLAQDPRELTNLAGRPEQAARVAQMHRDLVKEVGREPDESERICRADLARGYDDAPAAKAAATE